MSIHQSKKKAVTSVMKLPLLQRKPLSDWLTNPGSFVSPVTIVSRINYQRRTSIRRPKKGVSTVTALITHPIPTFSLNQIPRFVPAVMSSKILLSARLMVINPWWKGAAIAVMMLMALTRNTSFRLNFSIHLSVEENARPVTAARGGNKLDCEERKINSASPVTPT
jgi:hypothetical protein